MDFLVCSSFPPLKNQTVVEHLVDWVAPLYRCWRQKLAAQSHTPTLLHINHRDEDSLRDRIYILEAWCYVSWWLAGCELTLSHPLKHLRLVGANFAYQLNIVC